MRIPLDRQVAEAYAEGVPLVDALPGYRANFSTRWQRLEELVHGRGSKLNASDD
jgi:hypothetical protein